MDYLATLPSGLTFFVAGLPKAQPRARACRRGKHVGVYDPGTSDHWKGAIVLAARQAYRSDEPIREAVYVDVLWRFPRPKSHLIRGRLRQNAPADHTSKPDRDNLDKAVLDALVDARILEDDAIVAGGVLGKTYAGPQESPGAWITIRRPGGKS